jgi:hypothetical protein
MKEGSVVELPGDAMCAVGEMSSGIEGLCVWSELWRALALTLRVT